MKIIKLFIIICLAVQSKAEPVTLQMAKAAALAYSFRANVTNVMVYHSVQVCDTNIARTVLWNHITLVNLDNSRNIDILVAPVTELDPIVLKLDNWPFMPVIDQSSPCWILNILSDVATDIREQLRERGLYEEDPPPIEYEPMPSSFTALPSQVYPVQGYRSIVDFGTSDVIFEFWIDKKWIDENRSSPRLTSVLSGDDAVSLAIMYLLSGVSHRYMIYGMSSQLGGEWEKVCEIPIVSQSPYMVIANNLIENNIITWTSSNDANCHRKIAWLIENALYDEFILQVKFQELSDLLSVKIERFNPITSEMMVIITSETVSINGGRLLAAVPDPEFEIVLLSKKSFTDESWTETVAGKVTIPPNGRIEFSSNFLNLTVKARIAAGDKFFKIKIR